WEAAVAGRALSAAGRRRLHHHRLGRGQAAARVPPHGRLRRVRAAEDHLARRRRRHLRGVVPVRASAGRSATLSLLLPRRWTDWIALALIAALMTGSVLSAIWLSRYSVAVHRLTRGVGDTVFYDADGQAWFRLDEQRHDVSLPEISQDLQHAVLAVED